MTAAFIVRGQKVGAAKVERARELRRLMTPHEQTLWERLRGGRLAGLRFRRQQVIGGFIVDFYCHAAALVVEVDGAAHADHAAYDAERNQVLATRGLRILRVKNDEVASDVRSVLTRILAQARLSPASQPTNGARTRRPTSASTAPLSPWERGRG